MAFPKFCRNCTWSKPEENSEWNLRCHNPKVAVSDQWNLSSAKINGTSCVHEREKTWLLFPACGKSGKLYLEKQT